MSNKASGDKGKGKASGGAKKGQARHSDHKPSKPHPNKDLQASQMQGLILADSFDEYFRPVTYDLPRVR